MGLSLPGDFFKFEVYNKTFYSIKEMTIRFKVLDKSTKDVVSDLQYRLDSPSFDSVIRPWTKGYFYLETEDWVEEGQTFTWSILGARGLRE